MLEVLSNITPLCTSQWFLGNKWKVLKKLLCSIEVLR